MRRRDFLIGVYAAAAAVSSCGKPATTPDPVVEPPAPDPPPAPAPPVAAATLRMSRILTFGDSLTEGTTTPAVQMSLVRTPGLPQSYPYKLQNLLTTRYPTQTIAVLNAGVAGERATEGRDRIGREIDDNQPQVVLLMDGANDLLGSGAAGMDPALGAMEDMVRDILRRGLDAIVMTLPPQRPDTRRGTAAPLIPEYNRQLMEMATKKGARIFDINPLFDLALIGNDGLHPTEAGYDRLAAIVADMLKDAYEVAP